MPRTRPAWRTAYRVAQNFDAGPLPPTIAGRPKQDRPKPDLRSPSTPYDLLTYPQAVRSFGEFGARRDGKRRFRRQAGQQPRRETTAPQRLSRAAAGAERILTSGKMAEGMGFEPTVRRVPPGNRDERQSASRPDCRAMLGLPMTDGRGVPEAQGRIDPARDDQSLAGRHPRLPFRRPIRHERIR